MTRFERAQMNGAVSGTRLGLIASSVLAAVQLFSNGWPPATWWMAYFLVFIAVRSTAYLVVYWLTLFYIEPPAFLIPQDEDDETESREIASAPAPVSPEPKRPQLPKRPQSPQPPPPEIVTNEIRLDVEVSYPVFPYGADILAALVASLNENRKMMISNRSLDRAKVVGRDPRSDGLSAATIVTWLNMHGLIRHLGNSQHTLTEYGEGWLDSISPLPHSPEKF